MIQKEVQIICGRVPSCGFRAHDGYFYEKKRFMAGVCPRCGGPVQVVEAFTDIPVKAIINTDVASPSYGKIRVGV